MGTVELKDLAQLQRAIAELGRQIEREIAVSCWRAAQWARGAATRATLARDAVATRTFVQAWLSKRLNDGAIFAALTREEDGLRYAAGLYINKGIVKG